MTEDKDASELGQIVRILRGREQGQYAIIIGMTDDRFVLLSDGDKRKYSCPKKKNKRHIEYTPFISSDVRRSLLETGRVSNRKLRFALEFYSHDIVTDSEKGDGNGV